MTLIQTSSAPDPVDAGREAAVPDGGAAEGVTDRPQRVADRRSRPACDEAQPWRDSGCSR